MFAGVHVTRSLHYLGPEKGLVHRHGSLYFTEWFSSNYAPNKFSHPPHAGNLRNYVGCLKVNLPYCGVNF